MRMKEHIRNTVGCMVLHLFCALSSLVCVFYCTKAAMDKAVDGHGGAIVAVFLIMVIVCLVRHTVFYQSYNWSLLMAAVKRHREILTCQGGRMK